MEPLCATILVLVVTSRTIILAADSKKTHLYPDGIVDGGSMKKIHKTGDYYYASSGLYEDGSFNLHTILHNLLSQYPDLNAALTNIAAALTAALKSYFANLKKSSPVVFAQYLQHSGAGGEIFIVKRCNNIPSAAIIDYRVCDSTSPGILLNTWKIDTATIKSADACFWRAVGNTAFFSKPIPSEKEMAAQPILQAKKIIEDGISTYPCLVGAPITILEMHALGEKML